MQETAGAGRKSGCGRIESIHTYWRSLPLQGKSRAMDKTHIIAALDAVAAQDTDVAAGLSLVGYPEPRLRPHGFNTLLSIIVSQQISKEAAGAIQARLEALNPGGQAEPFLALGPDAIRAAGLSRPKVAYALGLADAIASGTLNLQAVATMPDEQAVAAIMGLKGFGRWSAEIYCMFSLQRQDLFPGEDIALQEAMRRLKGLPSRPDAKQARLMAEEWSPHRSSMAVFLWHYYRGAPA
jgi:DNA-3-methyladenine glycosylase II